MFQFSVLTVFSGIFEEKITIKKISMFFFILLPLFIYLFVFFFLATADYWWSLNIFFPIFYSPLLLLLFLILRGIKKKQKKNHWYLDEFFCRFLLQFCQLKKPSQKYYSNKEEKKAYNFKSFFHSKLNLSIFIFVVCLSETKLVLFESWNFGISGMPLTA